MASQIIGLNRSEIESGYLKSFNYEKMGSYSNAIKAMSTLYKAYPTGYAINLRMGYLYSANQNYAKALRHYEVALFTVPGSIEPQLGKMSVLLAQGNYQDAIKVGKRIIAVDHYNYYGNLKLAYALQMTGNYSLSDKIALKMLALYPTDVLFLTQYGSSLYSRHQISDAKNVLSDVLLFDPNNVTAKQILRTIKVQSNKSAK